MVKADITGTLVSLICVRQTDLKPLIAYSPFFFWRKVNSNIIFNFGEGLSAGYLNYDNPYGKKKKLSLCKLFKYINTHIYR